MTQLGLLRDPAAGDTLMKVATNAIPMPTMTRRRGLFALGEIRDPRFVPDAVGLVADTDEESLVQAIIFYFDKVKDVRAVPTLLEIASRKGSHVELSRGAALRTVRMIAPDLCVDALVSITKDADEISGIVREAMRGLAKAGTQAAIHRLREMGRETTHPEAIYALALLMNPQRYMGEDDDDDQ